jgi:acyl-CoA thioester hydrolase
MRAEPSATHSAMQSPKEPQSRTPWRLQRRVLPQHTDHAGVMWHGSYLAWLEEARVEALAAAGLAYADLSAAGYELPVVSLALDYRQALLHGESIQLESWVLPRRGLKLPWLSRFVKPDGRVAAEARVELVLVALASGEGGSERRLLRHMPQALAAAVERLQRGPG